MIYTEARMLIRMERFECSRERRTEVMMNREIALYENELTRSRFASFPQNRTPINPGTDNVFATSPLNIYIDKAYSSNTEKKAPDLSQNPFTKESSAINKRTEVIFPEDDPLSSFEKGIVNTKAMSHRADNDSKLEKALSFNKRLNFKIKQRSWAKWKLFVLTSKNISKTEDVLKHKIDDFMYRLKRLVEIEESKLKKDKFTTTKKGGALHPPPKLKSVKGSQEDKDLMEISQEIADSTADTKNQLRNESISTLSPALKGKAKLIRLISTISRESPSPLDSPPSHPPPPIILIEMDEKHEQRKQRLLQIQHRKRLIEETKDRIAKEKYEEQLLNAEREKKRKIKEFREKQRREQIEMEKRKIEWAKMKQLNEMAINHYNRKLIAKEVFQPWLALLRHRQQLNIQATQFNIKRIKSIYFREWRAVLIRSEQEKVIKALALRAKQQLRSVMAQWRSVGVTRKLKWQVAEDWSDMRIVRMSLNAWRDFVWIEQWETQEKWKQAAAFERKKLLGNCLQHWMMLPLKERLDRQKEIRLRQWREKVQQVLPDFRPNWSIDYQCYS